MRISEIIWKKQFVEKILKKHGVTTDEMEQVLSSRSHFRKAKKGRIKGEDLYEALGQTQAGRHLVIWLFTLSTRTDEQPCQFRLEI